MSYESFRKEFETEVLALKSQEEHIDAQLSDYFSALAGGQAVNSKIVSNDASDLNLGIKKIERLSACFEAMVQDSKKLVTQVGGCRALSDKMSTIVRRLDTMQIRAHQALACTEDIINLKDCKSRMQSAMQDGNLPLAVSFLKQVHDIDIEAAKASDDYAAILQTENELRELVRAEYSKAISESNITGVMSLCPLFQTLGLESEARDTFLSFIEETVFIAISADAYTIDADSDQSTGYAQALSNIFNTAFLIFQQYLPMVIQGMEVSLGDVYFIRRLHSKCECEAGLVLKRYLKFRNAKELMAPLQAVQTTGTNLKGTKIPTHAEVHAILDELALLIQYCSMYAKYVSQLCSGAESRPRTHTSRPAALSPASPASLAVKSTPGSAAVSLNVVVFPDDMVDFSKMVDELTNSYYMVGEQWLMRAGVGAALAAAAAASNCSNDGDNSSTAQLTGSTISVGMAVVGVTAPAAAPSAAPTTRLTGGGLDECFFVLKRCAMRSLATNNIHAACAVLNTICNVLSTELLTQMSSSLTDSARQISAFVRDHVFKYMRTIGATSGVTSESGFESTAAGKTITQGLQSAMSLASSAAAAIGAAGTGRDAAVGGLSSQLQDGSDSAPTIDGIDGAVDDDDPWGIGETLEAFNIAEICVRYTERLAKEVSTAGDSIFKSEQASGQKKIIPSSSSLALSTDAEKLRLIKEEFDGVRISFAQALRAGAEKIVSFTQLTMKELLVKLLGRGGPMGGIKFDAPDDSFDSQPALAIFPKCIVTPFEEIIVICTHNLSENNRDIIVGLLADACCERLEHFISQTCFHFAGALKFEECVRALTGLFTRCCSTSIRSKFARLREVMLVLTSDVQALQSSSITGERSNVLDNFSTLTMQEVAAYVALRTDKSSTSS